MDYARFLSKTTIRQRKNLVRKMAELYMKNPKSITLAAGMPNAGTFPFEEISVTYKGGFTQKIRGPELSTSLQYSTSQGNGLLLEKMRSFQKRWHTPVRQDWDIIFTVGSQDALFKVFSMLVDEEDPIMAQAPSYPGILGVVSEKEIQILSK